MSKINTTLGLLSRTGLVLSSLVAITVSASAIDAASAAELRVKFDGNEIELRRNSGGSNNSGDSVVKKKSPPRIISANTKGDQEEGSSGKKVFPRIAIGKGDQAGKKPKTQQIVVGKGDQAEENEAPRKRQVIVEPKLKKNKKIVVAEAAPKKLKKNVVVAAIEEPAVEKVADAAPAEEAPAVTEEQAPATEAPAEETTTDEQVEAETPAAPQQKFEVGQIVTGGDGNQYIIVKVNEASVSVMPLSAYAEYEQPKKVYKKKRHKKRYSSYGYNSYGGSSCQ